MCCAQKSRGQEIAVLWKLQKWVARIPFRSSDVLYYRRFFFLCSLSEKYPFFARAMVTSLAISQYILNKAFRGVTLRLWNWCWIWGSYNCGYEEYLWDVIPYSRIELRPHFGGIYCLHLQSRRISLLRTCCQVARLTSRPCRQGLNVSKKKSMNVYKTTRRHIPEDITLYYCIVSSIG
jgi:hypothetical protein